MSEFQQVIKDGAKKIGTGIKKGALLLLLLTVVGGGIYLWVCNWTYSEGTRAGILIKISKKGVIWKTYEGQLNMGGVQTGDQGLSGNIWDFSVTKKSFYDTFQNHEGQNVKLHYREVYKAMPWQGKTNYFVYKIEPVNNPSPQ